MDAQPDLTLVLEAFERNGAINRVLLDDLGADDLVVADGRGGWTIGAILAHMVGFRRGWLTRVSPAHAERLPAAVELDSGAPRLRVRPVGELATALDAGDHAARAAVQDAVTEGRTFEAAYRSHPAQFLVHTIVHDAHHRGQITSLLRLGGRRTAEELEALEDATWPIWRG